MKCHEWIGSISWNFISLCLHLCSSAVCCHGAVLYCRMNWKPPGVFVLWKQVQPLQRSDWESPPHAGLFLRSGQSAVSSAHAASAGSPTHSTSYCFHYCPAETGFSGSDTGARRSRGGRTAASQSGPRDNPEFGNFQSRFYLTTIKEWHDNYLWSHQPK